MTVRPYAPRDRAAVRRLCCDTADRGEPMERFFRDREVFADLVTRYYTEHEPERTWIAEDGGQVVGYLTGCRDTRRYWRVMARRILPAVVGRMVWRGTWWHRQTWALLWGGARTWWGGGFRRPLPLDQYPAHFHIDLRQEARGHHVGQALITRFLDQLRAEGVPGVHLVTRDDNTTACRFFESVGFSLLSRHPMTIPIGASWEAHDALVYALRLAPA